MQYLKQIYWLALITMIAIPANAALAASLEDQPGEYSYPAIIQTADGSGPDPFDMNWISLPPSERGA